MLRPMSVLIIAGVVLSACESGPFKKGSNNDMSSDGAPVLQTGLVPAIDTRFADVPLPMGIKEDIERTFVYESQSLQLGRLIYTTKSEVTKVAQFYIEEAPKHDWNLVNVLQADGTHLTFQKQDKRMLILVRDLGIGRGGTQLIITLIPNDDTGQVRTSISPL